MIKHDGKGIGIRFKLKDYDELGELAKKHGHTRSGIIKHWAKTCFDIYKMHGYQYLINKFEEMYAEGFLSDEQKTL